MQYMQKLQKGRRALRLCKSWVVGWIFRRGGLSPLQITEGVILSQKSRGLSSLGTWKVLVSSAPRCYQKMLKKEAWKNTTTTNKQHWRRWYRVAYEYMYQHVVYTWNLKTRVSPLFNQPSSYSCHYGIGDKNNNTTALTNIVWHIWVHAHTWNLKIGVSTLFNQPSSYSCHYRWW